MAFYLKLLEIYNTQGQLPPQTPGPGSLRSGCRPPCRAAPCRYNFELCPPIPSPISILPPCNAVKAP